MGGRPKDPAYWRKWRAAHPVYQERERERCRGRVRPSRALMVIEDVPLDHPLLDEAKRCVGPLLSSQGRGWRFPSEMLHEELVSEAVLALVEGSDPRLAIARTRRREYEWLRAITWLADDDGNGRLDEADHRAI